jgi:energy-converting hydrogenase B subunit D
MGIEPLFDIVLAGAVVVLAWRVTVTPTVFRSVVLFITLGLMMALAWVRLDAVDVALAEAAIGAGLTGVLLLDAVGHIEGRRKRPEPEEGS